MNPYNDPLDKLTGQPLSGEPSETTAPPQPEEPKKPATLEEKMDSLIECVTELTKLVGNMAKSQGTMASKIKAGRF